MNSQLDKLIAEITKFRDARNWKQFHNPKDMALSLVLEASEVLEHFQWKNQEEMLAHVKVERKEISKELADVLYWVLLMSNDFGIDIEKALKQKMTENKKKYPVSKAKGKHTKYNKL
jgi:NTP pyrophosphatase (non-canonical NTP hydrolase)